MMPGAPSLRTEPGSKMKFLFYFVLSQGGLSHSNRTMVITNFPVCLGFFLKLETAMATSCFKKKSKLYCKGQLVREPMDLKVRIKKKNTNQYLSDAC